MLLFLLLCWPAAATAQSPQLPHGKWQLVESSGEEICVEVLEDFRLRLTFRSAGSDDWKPIVIGGTYRITANKFGSFHAEMKIQEIRQKGISRCRKYVVDNELPETTQLGVKMQPGQILRLTFHFACADRKEHLQLCLHQTETEKTPRVICKDFQQENASCRSRSASGPAIDGSLLNRPPK